MRNVCTEGEMLPDRRHPALRREAAQSKVGLAWKIGGQRQRMDAASIVSWRMAAVAAERVEEFMFCIWNGRRSPVYTLNNLSSQAARLRD